MKINFDSQPNNNEIIKSQSEIIQKTEPGIKKDDPFMVWMLEKSRDGKTTDFSHINFIKDTIVNKPNREALEKALGLALSLPETENRLDLTASLYALLDNEKESLKLILDYKDRDLDDVMVGALSLLLKKNPEKRKEIMQEVSVRNPELIEYIKNRY